MSNRNHAMKLLFAIPTIFAISALQPAWAGGHGGGGMGGGMGMGMGMGAGGSAGFGASGFSHGTPSDFGGRSSTHVHANAISNSNGPNATDRDFGKDRAEDRKSATHSASPSGGSSSSHISASAITNSNGPNSTDRDFGKDRAEDRKDRSK